MENQITIKELFKQRLAKYKDSSFIVISWKEYKECFLGTDQSGWSWAERIVNLIIKIRRND